MSYDYHSCDVNPWLAEIIARMHECHRQGLPILNLSYTHPRGYIPPQILRRKKVQELLKGWVYDPSRSPLVEYPAHRVWTYQLGIDFNTCPVAPFEQEIARREEEAVLLSKLQEQTYGVKVVPIVDLTAYHERGAIPKEIMARLARRKSSTWVADVRAEIESLFGQANKDEAFAKTQQERAVGMQENGKDGTALLAAAQNLLAKAEQARQYARFLKSEIGERA